jgi:hypothetical protein
MKELLYELSHKGIDAFIHGPEIWIALCVICAIGIAICLIGLAIDLIKYLTVIGR